MKKHKNSSVLLAVLVVALAAVVAYIVLKQLEYGASTNYYGSLRGRL